MIPARLRAVVFVSLVALGACGETEGPPDPTPGSPGGFPGFAGSGGATAGSAGLAGAAGVSAGAGGAAAGGTAGGAGAGQAGSGGSTAGSAGSTAGTSGSGGAGAGGAGGSSASAFFAVASCDFATAEDKTSVTAVTITFAAGAPAYTPACVKVKKGTTVTFPQSSSHPLRGMVQNGTQPNPVTAAQATGPTSIPVTFTAAGSYGFHCDFHGADAAPGATGMSGAVYVVE